MLCVVMCWISQVGGTFYDDRIVIDAKYAISTILTTAILLHDSRNRQACSMPIVDIGSLVEVIIWEQVYFPDQVCEGRSCARLLLLLLFLPRSST